MGTIRLLLVTITVAACPVVAAAWGTTGHRIIAGVATSDLPPDVVQKIATLLQGKTLVDVANLPDEWQRDQPATRSYHYVAIPLRATGYDPRRDCPNNDCLVAAIKKFETVLADSTKPNDERREALIYLAHLVADAHAPLHVTNNDDFGGNGTKVRFQGQTLTLHSYWDSAVVYLLTGTPPEKKERLYVRKLAIVAARRGLPFSGDVEHWVNESHEIAKRVYQYPRSEVLDGAYEATSMGLAEERILLAAMRLRALLIRFFSDRGAR